MPPRRQRILTSEERRQLNVLRTQKAREARSRRAGRGPKYGSAAAVAAAVVQGEPFKPREERGWEEFHPELDIEADFPAFGAPEVDGLVIEESNTPTNVEQELQNGDGATEPATPSRHPVIRQVLEQSVVIQPRTPKKIPPPAPNVRERLTLPKPSCRRIDPFMEFEESASHANYVDRTMAAVGYQESELYGRPDKTMLRFADGNMEEDLDLGLSNQVQSDANPATAANWNIRVEYDMDEQDQIWLDEYNKKRKEDGTEPLKPYIFEITMTKIEKEWHALEKRIPKPNPKPPQTHRPRSSSAAAVNGEGGDGEEPDSKCAICDDGDCENTNAIVFCDGCDLAVHQECYGVPHIPEGQWLCRRCHLLGRSHTQCIFCPNTDGAFKQTNSSKWAHLLCAIWIPEVSIGNMSLMEPIMDVERVPKSRWKLKCYICRQQMGACIQCGNKNCFQAFHATCARRARLSLQLKPVAGGPASLDGTGLKAYCDKHVSDEWRKEHDTDRALHEAMRFYQISLRDKHWGDSQHAALDLTSSDQDLLPSVEEHVPRLNLVVGSNKRKRGQPLPSKMWKLPSGAPIIPETVYSSIEASLARFTVRKRKEFTADMCRYWTLKREEKRGAALIKRLQLQMETFSSMEVTRRNFVGMGAAGRPRLQRRIDFAGVCETDVEKLLAICEDVKAREQKKLEEVEVLRSVLDTVYYPLPNLLRPVIDQAIRLDSKGFFRLGLWRLRDRIDSRFYTSVNQLSTDLGIVFATGIGLDRGDATEVQNQIIDDKGRKDLDSEQKALRALAKRIIKAVQPGLEGAMRKESELLRVPFEKELLDMDQILTNTLKDIEEVNDEDVEMKTEVENEVQAVPTTEEVPVTNGVHANGVLEEELQPNNHVHPPDQHMINGVDKIVEPLDKEAPANSSELPQTNGIAHAEPLANGHATSDLPPSPPQSAEKPDAAPAQETDPEQNPVQPPLVVVNPLLTCSLTPAVSHSGKPWYMQPFDPAGTTIFEERWIGRDVARGMSEELSDLDDDELAKMDLDESILPNGEEEDPEPIEETEEEMIKRKKREKERARRRAARRLM